MAAPASAPTEHGISSFGVFDRMKTAAGERHLASAISSKSRSLGHVEVHELDGLTAGLASKVP